MKIKCMYDYLFDDTVKKLEEDEQYFCKDNEFIHDGIVYKNTIMYEEGTLIEIKEKQYINGSTNVFESMFVGIIIANDGKIVVIPIDDITVNDEDFVKE